MSEKELLAWVAAILQREQSEGTTGEVRVQLHEGIIQRARVEKVEKPG